MNNLYRKLAPISHAAWAEIEEEAARTLKRHLAARCIVDVEGPQGLGLSSVGTGHVHKIKGPDNDIQALLREAQPVVEFRIPFELSRQEIDNVERGSEDSDWGPLQEAAKKIAFAEDRAIFEGYAAAKIQGLRQGSENQSLHLPAHVRNYPAAVAQAISQLRLQGVNGPYALVLGARAYTAASGGSDEGYPVLHHIRKLVDDRVIWAPAIEGGFVVSIRGGDFQMSLGQDISIGYLSHTSTVVKLYFQESFAFRLLSPEAVVPLSIPKK